MHQLKNTHFVIVTYNGERFIKACIQAIQNESPTSPVHVIDNGSNDHTLHILSTLGVSVLETGKNLGFGRANNIGISTALKQGAKHVFLINQDAYIQAGSLKRFFSLPESQTTNLHAFIQLNGEGSKLDQKFKSNYLLDHHCPNFLDDTFFNRVQSSYEVQFINAASWILPRKLLMQLGGFNPSFFHYGEDDNYVARLHHHGFKLMLYPECIVHHDRGDRPKSKYFDDKPKKERLFLQRISHPSNRESSHEILKKTKRNYWKKRLRGSKKSNIIERIQLDFLMTNSIQDIVRNRNLTKTKGPHFLDPVATETQQESVETPN